ncbi:MAG: cytochrome c3 family protein [Thermodesulfovibrionales bacterium]|jgi:predicted CXXCH cytochrome family protein
MIKVLSLVLVFLFSGISFGAEVDCLLCHEALSKGKTVHPAVLMGCTACHTGIDATEIPHKKTNTVVRGLAAEPPDLCYNCHDKTIFEKKTVHPALLMGCTACHNPHATETPRLLLAEPPDICFNCHDKAEFTKQNVHVPVAAGMCTTCHNPHSTDEVRLLNNKAVEVCLQCHADKKDTPHAITGFSSAGHPIGDKRTVKDPARPDRTFYCGSCHNPHSSDSMRLFRYKADTAFELCVNCHQK